MMTILRIKNLKPYVLGFILLTLLTFLPSFASSQETYKFERMWPTLKQPWYFGYLGDIVIDSNRNIYVSSDNRILKLTSDGEFITKLDFSGKIALDTKDNIYLMTESEVRKLTPNGDIIFEFPLEFRGIDIASDTEGNVYVLTVDTVNIQYYVQKFNPCGTPISQWLLTTSGWATGITVDSDGHVHILYGGSYQVEKLNSSGSSIFVWPLSDDYPHSYFEEPMGIEVDWEGNVYVAGHNDEVRSGVIHKYSSEGNLTTSWVSSGSGDERFSYPTKIAIDPEGNLYVTEWCGAFSQACTNVIRKFTSNLSPITFWSSSGYSNGKFHWPAGVAVDSVGNIYVTEKCTTRIQKFNANGEFSTSWNEGGFTGGGDDSCQGLRDITIGPEGMVYVADAGNNRIQKFTPDGTLLSTWGSDSDGNYDVYAAFYDPTGIVVDQQRNVYVSDGGRIQKFDLNGSFIDEWNLLVGHEGGEIALGPQGNIYVSGNNYGLGTGVIQKYSPNGQSLAQWEISGYAGAIAVDQAGNIYIEDTSNDIIQKFTNNGTYLTQWGHLGTSPGELIEPSGIAVNGDEKVFVSDTINNRIQVFKKVTISDNSKAIIVAGRESSGNSLWNATQMCANFTYRTLTYQGFTKESIYYLTSDVNLDLDSNGVADDVDADATNDNLEYAITTWALDADNLTIYLTDHGGDDTFRMDELETLSATDLASWLNTLQNQIPGKMTIIYDACQSGSFLAELAPPPGMERIVIASADAGESAYFIAQGTISFSYYFWTHVFNGLNIYDAFDLAQQATSFTSSFQHPLLDDNGDGIGNQGDGTLAAVTYIGNGTSIADEAPVIGEVSSEQTIVGSTTASLYADGVTDEDGIARVWAVIRAPDYNQGSPDNPVQELPSIDLLPVGGNRYEGTYNDFNVEGTYQILIYVRDGLGSTSIPELTTVIVESPLTRKAVIVAGDTDLAELWQAIEKNAELAYETLRFQGYQEEDLYFLSPETFHGGIIGLPTLSNIAYALGDWAENNTQDLVVYLIGEGTHGNFTLSETESLTASHLDTLLDDLQTHILGKVVLVYDACQSGSFLPYLAPPMGKERILAASTDAYQPAYFLSGGDISYSNFFWDKVLNGSSVRDSFNYATDAVRYANSNQAPLLEGNGNGLGNESEDRNIARYYTIGMGIILAGDAPIIGSVDIKQTSQGGTTATIAAYDVTTTGSISKVSVTITPPGFTAGQPENPVTDLPNLDLISMGDGSYEENYDFSFDGIYQATVYAVDDEGIVSMPKEMEIFVNNGHIGTQICEGDFDCDNDQDGTDAAKFKEDFGRSSFNDPCTEDNSCNGNFDVDQDVDGMDAAKFKEDFGRCGYNNVCPTCIVESLICSP